MGAIDNSERAHMQNGECTKDADDLLRSYRLQKPPKVKGDTVQEVARVQVRPGQEALRQKAAGFRRTVKAHPQEEGQDHQEDRPSAGVLEVQGKASGASQED